MLEYAEFGDPEGVPVVLQPGTPATCGAGGIVEAVAVRHGVRLVAVSRPGYAASALTPPGLASVADQVLLLADRLGLGRFGVWGLSGGGPYALAQAASTADRLAGVVVAAGPAPGDPVRDVGELEAEAAELAARFAGLDAQAFVAQTPPTERYFRDHPQLAGAFVADMRRALAGSDGYVRDNLSMAGAWDVSLAAVTTTSVDLVYGDDDQMVTLDNGQRLAAQVPGARLHVLPGAGHGAATFGAADLALRLLSTNRASASESVSRPL